MKFGKYTNMNEKESKILLRNLKKLNTKLSNNNFINFIEILGNWKKILWRNFISGVSKGIGIGIGFSIITAIILLFLQKIITLNIPIISQYISDIIEIINLQLNK